MSARIAILLLVIWMISGCAHYPQSVDDQGSCSLDHAIKGLCR
ncbi:MAG TPA: hypothetical protein VK602_19105 [Phyllobacterium sp.]|nr:hypothetical protein [Phyllobacterium sp.]